MNRNKYKNCYFCHYCKKHNHRHEECKIQQQDNQPCTDAQGCKYWLKRYKQEEQTQKATTTISALKGLMTPLIQSPLVIPQLIQNLDMVSIAACNKLFKVLAPGNRVQLRLNVQASNQTSSWLFDTGAIACMNSRSFFSAFAQQKPKRISTAQSCVDVSGEAMNSIGVYEVELWINGKKSHFH
jgi:hypothetical protein